jgi:cytidylate kinase
MNNKKINIAIDGFSSCGKSTLAKKLAEHLNYIYLDTGAMYRCVTLYAVNNGIISNNHFDKEKLKNELNNIKIDFKLNPKTKKAEAHLNGKNVEQKIRSIEISNLVSEISQLPEVRKKMVALQQKIAENKGVVMDGRDIGTVVLPNAELKLFMTASPKIRAERRYKEMLEKGENVNFNEILENINKRDYLDQNRSESPLKKAKDAIELDNSKYTIKQEFDIVLNLINKLK